MDLQFLTSRELLSHRKLLLRALQRGRNTSNAEELVARINNELEKRRDQKMQRFSSDAPEIDDF